MSTKNIPSVMLGIGDPETRRRRYLRNQWEAELHRLAASPPGDGELHPCTVKVDSSKLPTPPGSVFYYPGAGTDTGPMRLAIGALGAGTVIHSDYLVARHQVLDMLRACSGWARVRNVQRLSSRDLGLAAWDAFWPQDPRSRAFSDPSQSWGLTCVLETEDRWVRFVFLGTDAHQTYANLLNTAWQPRLVWLQDHGFGANWTDYAGQSLMWKVAVRQSALPRFLLCPPNQRQAWPGYCDMGEWPDRKYGLDVPVPCNLYANGLDRED